LNFFIKKNIQFIILLLILIYSFSFVISFYHFGIEQGFFEESVICSVKDASDLISKEDILSQLQNKTVNCRDVTFKIFGFSLTTINIFLSFVLIIMLLNIYKNYEKFKK
jgi:disulfide bond formation protein DsbB